MKVWVVKVEWDTNRRWKDETRVFATEQTVDKWAAEYTQSDASYWENGDHAYHAEEYEVWE